MKTLELISNMMTRVKTRVGMSGEKAFTDGENITLPALPLDDPESMEMLHGYLDHEDSHVVETDFSVRNEGLVQTMVNVIEDCRIEKKRGDEYVGIRHNLVRLTELAVKRNLMAPGSEADDPMILVQKLVLYELYAEWCGYESIYATAQQTRDVCVKVLPKGMRIRLEAMIPEAKSCKNTQDVADLSKRILQMMEDETKEEPPENQQPNEQGQAGQDGNTESPTGTIGEQPNTGNLSGSTAPGEAERKQKMREAMQSGVVAQHGIGEAVKQHLQMVESKAIDAGKPVLQMPQPEPYKTSLGSIDEAINAVDAVTIGLRQCLSGRLLAKTRTQRCYSTSGELVPMRLWRLKVGDTRVFQRKVEGLKLNTALTVLLDGSGSMAGTEIEIARQASLALSLTLDSINVANSVGIFSGSGSTVGVVKTFDERAYDVANRLPSVKASGGTPLYPSLLWSIQGLMQRRETRKIVMVISDGQPAAIQHCQKLINMMSQGGVEVIGIGIKQSMSALISRSSLISDIQQLPMAMFDLLEETMQLAA